MKAPRITQDELNKLSQRPGYGIASAFGGKLKPAIGQGSVASAFGGGGKIDNVESAARNASIRSEALSLNYAGKVRVSVRFYRRRLADYSRAISEKAIIDALVYAGALRDDSEREICLIDEGQVKVESDQEERTEINLEYPEFDFDQPFIPRNKFGNAGTIK